MQNQKETKTQILLGLSLFQRLFTEKSSTFINLTYFCHFEVVLTGVIALVLCRICNYEIIIDTKIHGRNCSYVTKAKKYGMVLYG